MTTDKKRKPVIFDMRNGSYTIGEMLDDAKEKWGESIDPYDISIEHEETVSRRCGCCPPSYGDVTQEIIMTYSPSVTAMETQSIIGRHDGTLDDATFMVIDKETMKAMIESDDDTFPHTIP